MGPPRTQVILVTLPETTPVNEVIETAGALHDGGGLRLGPVVVNAFDEGDDLPLERAAADTPLRAAAEFRNARRALHRLEVARLGEELDLEQIRLPVVASQALDRESIAQLSERLGARS